MTFGGAPLWDRPEALASGTAAAGTAWRTPDVLVIGGGVAGLSVAAWCRMRGLGEVVLIEQQHALATGPSGRAAGALIPDVHALTHPAVFTALARRGLELHQVLHERWGASSTFRRARCRVLAPRVAEPVDLPEQGHVDPCALAAGLAGECGSVMTRTDATGWDVAGGGVVRVHTSAGEVHPGSVVVATGGWPDQLPQGRGAPVVGPVKGHLVATAPLPSPLEEIVVADVIAVPGPEGRVIAGGTFDVGDDLPDVRAPVVDHLRSALARVAPATAGVDITHAWTCFRPAAPDGLPIVDRVAGLSNAWTVAGLHHTGLLTAPAIGEAMADWIATGRRPALVAPFATQRLTAAP